MSALEAVLQRDRAVVVAALAVITAIAWADLVWLANDMWMGGMDMTGFRMIPAGQGWMMPISAPWLPIEFGAVFAMWVVMMIGMMTPSVAPMVLIYAGIARQARARGTAFAAAGWFASGYLFAWIAFALAATFAQWWLESQALIAPMMAGAGRVAGGIVLMLAGAYQWLPLKQSCLVQCGAPLAFVQKHGGFASSARGSLRLGVLHGFYCIGCCWALMALLFVFGVMNLVWIAGLMVYVLLEKLLPKPRIVSRIAGAAAIAAGLWMLGGGRT